MPGLLRNQSMDMDMDLQYSDNPLSTNLSKPLKPNYIVSGIHNAINPTMEIYGVYRHSCIFTKQFLFQLFSSHIFFIVFHSESLKGCPDSFSSGLSPPSKTSLAISASTSAFGIVNNSWLLTELLNRPSCEGEIFRVNEILLTTLLTEKLNLSRA